MRVGCNEGGIAPGCILGFGHGLLRLMVMLLGSLGTCSALGRLLLLLLPCFTGLPVHFYFAS